MIQYIWALDVVIIVAAVFVALANRWHSTVELPAIINQQPIPPEPWYVKVGNAIARSCIKFIRNMWASLRSIYTQVHSLLSSARKALSHKG